MDKHIHIVEVGPRDGLQNESKIYPVETRVKLIDLLSLCGFCEIEVGSFVSPKWVPQMANSASVFQSIHQNPITRYSVLVPNEKGMADAIATGVSCISIFTAASETFNQKNTNCSIAESFVRFIPVMKMAHDANIRVRGYISCAITCPYEGDIAPTAVADVAKQLDQLGCAEISLGDTIGRGTPETIHAMVSAVSSLVPVEKLAIHCHDTYGNAIPNILSALALGIKTIDSSIHGLGGCPYAGPQAKGNVATESVVAALKSRGYITTIDEVALLNAKKFVDEMLNFN